MSSTQQRTRAADRTDAYGIDEAHLRPLPREGIPSYQEDPRVKPSSAAAARTTESRNRLTWHAYVFGRSAAPRSGCTLRHDRWLQPTHEIRRSGASRSRLVRSVLMYRCGCSVRRRLRSADSASGRGRLARVFCACRRSLQGSFNGSICPGSNSRLFQLPLAPCLQEQAGRARPDSWPDITAAGTGTGASSLGL
jgi:hypothetical protein